MATGQGNIKITADTSQAQRALGDLDRALGRLEQSVGDGVKVFAAFTAAAAGIGYAIKSTLDSAGELIDAANAIGVSAQELSYLQKSAELAGIGADQLNMSLIRLSKNIGEAVIKGSDQATAAFRRLGIPLEDLVRLNPVQQFDKIVESLNQIPDRATRSALAVELLGKQGPMLLAAAENTKRLKDEMKALGLSLSDFDVQALDAAGDSLTEIKQIFDTALKKAVAEISVYIVAISKAIKQAIKDAGGFEVIWGKIKDAARLVVNVLLIMAGILAARILVSAVQFAGALVSAAKAGQLLNFVLARNPIMLALSAAIALAGVLGVDVVGALGDQFDMTKYIDEAQKEINQKVVDQKKALEANTAEMALYNEEQEKALKALGETARQLGLTVQYNKDVLAVGEDEAKVRKLIAEEAEKLAKVGLQLTPQQEQMLRMMQEELNISERLVKNKEAIKQLEEGGLVKRGLADPEVLKAQEQLSKAQADLAKVTGTKLQAEAERQVAAYQKNYDDMVAYSMMAASKELAVIRDKQVEINKIDTAIKDARLAGYLEDHIAIKLLNDAKIQAEEELQNTILKLQEDRIARGLAREKAAYQIMLSEQDKSVLQQIGQQERQKQYIASRIEFEKKSEAEKAAFAIDQGAQMFSALGQHNKRAFEAAKAFNIANAIMNTYLAATKALASYPPPFNFIAMAAAIGMGMAQVATIRSQQYSGRALGGPVMGGTPYLVGENGPELFTPNTTGSITRNGDLGGGQPVIVNFSIQAVDAEGIDTLLIERRSTIQQIISDAMLEKGQRM